MKPSRRELLLMSGAAAAGATLVPRFARGIGSDSKFQFGILDLGAGEGHGAGLRRLAWELSKRTSIDVELDPVKVELSAKSLAQSPFLVLSGNREFSLPKQKEIDALRRYLTFGGFLLIDSGEGSTDGAFDGSVRQLVDELFPRPQKGLELIEREHVIYKSFYLIPRPVGRLAISSTAEAVTRDERAVVVYSQNDLLGAWLRDDLGNYEYVCDPGGERQREFAYRLGVNVVMYALCLDYKSDQVHVPFILRRRKWRPNDGASTIDSSSSSSGSGKKSK